MEVVFQLTPEDIAAFQKFHARRYGSRWPVAVGVLIAVVLMLAPQLLNRRLWLRLQLFGPAIVSQQMLNSVMNTLAKPAALLSILIPLAFFLLFWLVLIPRLQRAEIKKSDAFLLAQTIRLGADGLFQSQASGDFLYRWTHIFGVAETETHIFVLIDQGTAVVVPKRAFAEPDASQLFFKTAQNYWQQNQDKSPPIPVPPSTN